MFDGKNVFKKVCKLHIEGVSHTVCPFKVIVDGSNLVFSSTERISKTSKDHQSKAFVFFQVIFVRIFLG